MSSFRTQFTIQRKSNGKYCNGRWQEGEVTEFTIMASVQPLSGEEMQMLPEGRKDTQAVRIYTDTPLKTVSEDNPDILLYAGNSYEVTTVEPWQSNVISHYKCLAVKIIGKKLEVDPLDPGEEEGEDA